MGQRQSDAGEGVHRRIAQLLTDDLDSGNLRSETEREQRVTQLLASDDGRYLAAVMPMEPWVHLHVVPVDALIEVAQSRVTRPLTAEECGRFLTSSSCPAD